MSERPRVVVSHWVHPEVLEALDAFAEPVSPDAVTVWSREELLSRCESADALVACMADRVDADFLEHCFRLRIVAATLKGYDNFDAEACARRGVWLTIVPEAIIEPTAELALGLTLGVMRRIREGDEAMRRAPYRGWRPQLYGTTLRSRAVGILGMGALGQAIAELLIPFGARTSYHDPDPLTPAAEARLGVRRRPLDALLSTSCVLIVALPLTHETRGLLSRDRIARMPTGGILINVGRGSTVDEDAIADALDRGVLGGYGADVFATEDWALADRPAHVPQALIEHPRTLLTPHLGSAVDTVRRQMSLVAVDQVRAVLAGETPAHAVNRPTH